MTTVLLLDFSDVLATILERDTGGLLMRDIKRRRRTTLLNDESVRPTIKGQNLPQYWSSIQLTSQEAVELHKELKIDIVTLRRLAVSAAHMMGVQIDTCNLKPHRQPMIMHAHCTLVF
jgi:hypothetical protein